MVAAMTAPNDSVEFGAELEPAYAIPVVIVVAVDLPGMVSSSVAVAAAPVSHATFQQTGMLASSRLDLGHRRRPRASCCAAADRAPDKVHSYRPTQRRAASSPASRSTAPARTPPPQQSPPDKPPGPGPAIAAITCSKSCAASNSDTPIAKAAMLALSTAACHRSSPRTSRRHRAAIATNNTDSQRSGGGGGHVCAREWRSAARASGYTPDASPGVAEYANSANLHTHTIAQANAIN